MAHFYEISDVNSGKMVLITTCAQEVFKQVKKLANDGMNVKIEEFPKTICPDCGEEDFYRHRKYFCDGVGGAWQAL